MTSQTFPINTLMAYVGTDADVVGVGAHVAMVDWQSSRVYLYGSSSGPGIRKFNLNTGGTELQQASVTSLGVFGVGQAANPANMLANDGSRIWTISKLANLSTAAAIQTSNLALISEFGIATSLGMTDTQHLLAPCSFGQLNGNLLSGGIDSTQEVDYLLADLPMPADATPQTGFLNGAKSFGVLWSPTDSADHTWVFGAPFSGSFPVTAAMSLYRVTEQPIGNPLLALVGNVTRTAIDATWTTWNNASPMARDLTDGGLIFFASTSAAVANQLYLVKINPTTATVMWATAVPEIFPAETHGLILARIQNQRLHYIFNSKAYHFDTSDGSFTTETIAGGTSFAGPQVSDDVTNSIITFGQYNGLGTLNLVGDYFTTHSSVLNQWCRLWFATESGGGEGDGGKIGGLALSVQRAWTYTLDGHTFYVLDLGGEGTFAYDVLTNTWSQFVTQGHVNWDMQAGVMWGNRIMACDLSSTDVWELVPAATDDQDGTLDIPHIVTGGLQTRNRDFHAVESLTVSGSMGYIGNLTNSAQSMRYSDDQGVTWSDYFTVDLEAGDYSQEIAFRSLGSFAAPGRVFELSDLGGLIRIDGADAAIDNFDEDNASGQTNGGS